VYRTITLSVSVLFVVAHLAVLHAGETLSADAEPRQVQRWIEQLDDDNYAIREAATEHLIRSGRMAIKPVAAAVISDSPEVSWRAGAILHQIAISGDERVMGEVIVAMDRLGKRGRQSFASRDELKKRWLKHRRQRAVAAIQRLGGEVVDLPSGSVWGGAPGPVFIEVGGAGAVVIDDLGDVIIDDVEIGGDIELFDDVELFDVVEPLDVAEAFADVEVAPDVELGPELKPVKAKPREIELDKKGGKPETAIKKIGKSIGVAIVKSEKEPLRDKDVPKPGKTDAQGKAEKASPPKVKPAGDKEVKPPAEARSRPVEVLPPKPVEAKEPARAEGAVEAVELEVEVPDVLVVEEEGLLMGLRFAAPAPDVLILDGGFTTPRRPRVSRTVRLGKAWKGSNEDLRLLKDIDGLTDLTLSDFDVKRAVLNRIAELPHLRRLCIENSQFDRSAVARLKKAKPDLTIYAIGKAYLGVSGEPAPGRFQVRSVFADSGAAKAGIQVGDAIESADGVRVTSIDELTLVVAQKNVGDKIPLTLRRNGKTLKIKATLGPRENLR